MQGDSLTHEGFSWSLLSLPPRAGSAVQPSPGIESITSPVSAGVQWDGVCAVDEWIGHPYPTQAAAHRDALELRLVEQVMKFILRGLDLLLVSSIHHVPEREGNLSTGMWHAERTGELVKTTKI